jgi:hypothetical protein
MDQVIFIHLFVEFDGEVRVNNPFGGRSARARAIFRWFVHEEAPESSCSESGELFFKVHASRG